MLIDLFCIPFYTVTCQEWRGAWEHSPALIANTLRAREQWDINILNVCPANVCETYSDTALYSMFTLDCNWEFLV